MKSFSLFVVLLCLFQYGVHSDLVDSAKGIETWIIRIRRKLHRIPELQFDLPKTSELVRNVLEDLKIPYKYPVAKSGIIAKIGSGKPVVALRADMDGLPIQEPAGLPFASRHKGQMHACGHDAHTAMLLGAARLLKQNESALKGTVKLVFQPAEEIGAGAKLMIEKGKLNDVSMMFGFHVWPLLKSGVIATKPGLIMGGSNAFKVIVTGKGGHASVPHLIIDPYIPVANMILSYQTIVSRTMSPMTANVISVTKVHGGEVPNVMPDSVTFAGTMRSLEAKGLRKLSIKFIDMTKKIAEAYGCRAQVIFTSETDPVINDPQATSLSLKVAKKLFGKGQVVETDASTAAEDFAYFGQIIPSSFIFLGIKNATLGSTALLHNPNFKLDEEILHKGAALHASLALDYLNQQFETKTNAKTEL